MAEDYRVMLTNYASSFLYEGKTDSALVYTLQAEKRSELDKDTAMLIENLNQLGAIYRRKKRLNESIHSLNRHFDCARLKVTSGRLLTFMATLQRCIAIRTSPKQPFLSRRKRSTMLCAMALRR